MAPLMRNEFLSFTSRRFLFILGGSRTSFFLSLSLSCARMSDVDETLFGNNNYRETCDMSKYSGCRGQRFALREHTYTSRVIHTLVCRSVIVDSQSLHCTYTYIHAPSTRAWDGFRSLRSREEERGERDEGRKCGSAADWTWRIREKLGKCGGLLANRFRASNKKGETCGETLARVCAMRYMKPLRNKPKEIWLYRKYICNI